MALYPDRKLQVFVSSTFLDLREERQAAVQAILTAGHIPAGMELFTAGNESQFEVIKSWIDDSDVFLLILGPWYGSLEPISEKSYIQLEYEYALETNTPVMGLVVSDEFEHVLDANEQRPEVREKYERFRKLVMSKMVRPWSDWKDIKIAISESMAQFSRRSDVAGWIKGERRDMIEMSTNQLSSRDTLNSASQEQDGGVVNGTSSQFLSGIKILLVDDYPPTLKLTKTLLRRFGAEVVIAQTGEEGLSALRISIEGHGVGSFDLVLMDGSLSDVSPEEWLIEAGTIAPIVKHVLVSAYFDEETSALAFDAFLAKPYMADTLLHTVQQVAGSLSKS